MDTGKFRFMSDLEYLEQIRAARAKSPVIAALCERIEALHNPRVVVVEHTNDEPVTCKYCGALDDGEDL